MIVTSFILYLSVCEVNLFRFTIKQKRTFHFIRKKEQENVNQTNSTDNRHTSRKYEKTEKITKERCMQTTENRSFDWFGRCHQNAEASRFSYHLQIHDCSWIPFYLKEENVWNNILELTKVDFCLDFFLFKYCRPISRDVMQSNLFFPRGQVLVFIKD